MIRWQIWLFFVCWSCADKSICGAEVERAFPAFENIIVETQRILAKVEGYEAGDIITRETAGKILSGLDEIGWKVPRQKELLAKVPANTDFLPTLMQTEKGRRFLRGISGHKLAFDRVDRLARLPEGKALVKQLVNGPDGGKLITYLTDTQGGKNLGKMLGQTANGENFNRPTGKIYTAKALLEELKPLHATEAARHK